MAKTKRTLMQVDPGFHKEINEIKRMIAVNMPMFDKKGIPSDQKITKKIVALPVWERIKQELVEENKRNSLFNLKRDKRRMR